MESALQLNAVSTFLDGALFKPNTKTLMQDYLEYAEYVRGFSPATLKGKRVYLKQLLEYLETNEFTDIRTVTNIDLDTYFVYMGRRVGTHSVNSCKRAAKSFLGYCENYRKIPLQVMTNEIRERRPDDKYPDILTHEEITAVIKRVKNKQDKLIIAVMYEAGLRMAEVIDLKIEHVRGRTLDVVGKGRRHRITYITPSLANELHSWMAHNGWIKGHVFRPQLHGKGGGYEDTETVRRRIKQHFKRLIGREMHPHLLRHAFALRLLHQKCDLRTIQKLLGHSKIETTMVYLQIDNDYLEKKYSQSFNRSVYA